ncbi:MAG: Holliday junction resolvase RuvX [Erysipelothrix sp.]|nr:Holliday junction resolvase RuvX [Erysipelothrix sp.]
MQRLIGLDLGSKTVGVAKSDLLKLVASVETTIFFQENDYQQALHLVTDLIQKYDVEAIVLGLPKHMNGDIGIRGEISNDFKILLEEKGYKVILWDERLSTKTAKQSLIAQNVSRKKRKGLIDQVAAVVILQSYLDSKL